MAIIPNYPPPVLPLTGDELLAGFSSGATRAIPVSAIIAAVLSQIASGQIQFEGLPDIANGDPKPSPGFPYLKAGALFIA